jgi:predicted transcriptional regulator of viral defense system
MWSLFTITANNAIIATMEAIAQRVAPRDLPDHLVGHGRYVFTLGDVERLCAVDHPDALLAVHRLKTRGKVFSPARGLYVVIPPEYRTWKVVPADWFIDPMMRHLRRPYYVSLLSAAAMHGAAHQAPMVYQVMTTGRVEDRDIGRVRLRFFDTARADKAPTQSFNVHRFDPRCDQGDDGR